MIFSQGSSDGMCGHGSKLHHRGGLDWILGISLAGGWSNTGTGFLKRWSMAQDCQC